jgi:hypothetical protein
MSILPAINCWEGYSKVNRKLLLGQLQVLPEFSNQLTDGWLLNTNVLLMKRHITRNL